MGEAQEVERCACRVWVAEAARPVMAKADEPRLSSCVLLVATNTGMIVTILAAISRPRLRSATARPSYDVRSSRCSKYRMFEVPNDRSPQ
jgi:hypothetical protein